MIFTCAKIGNSQNSGNLHSLLLTEKLIKTENSKKDKEID